MTQKYHNSEIFFLFLLLLLSFLFQSRRVGGYMVGVTVLRPWLNKLSCWLWISVSSVLSCFPLRKPSKTKPLSLDLNVSLLVFVAGMLISITLWSAAFSASLIVTCQTSSCVAQKTKSGGGSPPQCLEEAASRRSHFRCWEISSPNLVLTWHMTNFCTKICSWLLLHLRLSCFFDLLQQCTFNIFLLMWRPEV